jgi:hypothetical protein
MGNADNGIIEGKNQIAKKKALVRVSFLSLTQAGVPLSIERQELFLIVESR